MTKRKKRNQTNNKTKKALNKQREIPLTGNYLREQQLIDNLSCKIQEKCSLKNVLPAKLYVNTIKQVFEKFDIPAEYGYKDEEEFLELTIKIPKPKK